MYITSYKPNKTKTIIQTNIDLLFKGLDSVEELVETNDDELRRTITTVKDFNDMIEPDDLYKILKGYTRILNLNCSDPAIHYKSFKIPKRTRGFRDIDAPDEELSTTQREVARILRDNLKILPHDSAWAYIKQRDIVKAIREHKDNGSRWFLKIDLKNFFGSCNKEFIEKQLLSIYPFAYTYNLPEYRIKTLQVIERIINIATLNDGLPQGTPLSPYLTNIIMTPIDYQINKLLNNLVDKEVITKQRYVYTRYADDIIISAKRSFQFNNVVHAIASLLKDTPLQINQDKTRYGSNAGRNWNLGLMYNKDNEITVGHKKKHFIKIIIYNYLVDKSNYVGWSEEDLQYLHGQLAWLEHVEPTYYNHLEDYFKRKYGLEYTVKHMIIEDLKSH